MSFVHLHVHTQYSILDGLSDIGKLFERARELGMPALAITDHGNMYGVKEFFKFAYDKANLGEDKKPLVKPIIGCEVYVTRHYDHRLKDNDHRKYYHLTLLAKNYAGYQNLMKICTEGHIHGMYYKPRVSHEIIEQYHENLICCSACLAGELPRDIMDGNVEAAREALRWHKRVFGDDYYLEVMCHKTEVPGLDDDVYRAQMTVNPVLFDLAREEGVNVVATNDVHFIRKEDGPAHDRLICLTTNSDVDDPKRLRYTQQEYLKSEEEMAALFPEHPEVITNTLEVADKVELYKIDHDYILPKYHIDETFLRDIETYLEKYKAYIEAGKNDPKGHYRGDDFCKSVAYLCHLTYEGAKIRYGETLTDEQAERIDFELKTISSMGFPDYFLIVQDYIRAMRNQGWLVGPGRGSAAGSVVAYCLWITNLDPIKYQLLFERFLNPERISMPDIDVDFENLEAAHRYVEDTYGADHVSRVITFGTMLAKGAIKDVARISHVSIDESNRLSKMVPARLSERVKNEKGETEEKSVKVTLKNCFRLVPEFRDELAKENNELNQEVLSFAQQLEGSVRQVGMHACATIIGPGNLSDYIPICLSKDKDTGQDVWTSQYDGHYIEECGLLKMDFLGLNTLSIIHKTLDLIKQGHGVDIDIEAIPIDDKLTYELYSRGDTTSIFQFESPGMKEWLQKLQPERFEDLIAMNALYRPGPMDYIPDFVDRKQGIKPITYDTPEMEEYLKDTYGITVYQEQVMLLSQKLAGFTKGQADKLRKAMGKKKIKDMEELYVKFMEGGRAHGHDDVLLNKIWQDWRAFAEYAFNKSHATCYAWVSYQTAYLKAHYPAEFFAANLSCNLDNMDEITKIMDDCRRWQIQVLGPDVNESSTEFTVNKAGNVRFGMGGIKGVGAGVIDAVIAERHRGGPFQGIFDFVERMPLGLINRKVMECMVYAGAFDGFTEITRPQFFYETGSGKDDVYLDVLLRYAQRFQNDTISASMSLFAMDDLKPARPAIPPLQPEYNEMEFLKKEKECVGMYLSRHPLDRFKFEIEQFATVNIARLDEIDRTMQTDKDVQNKEFYVAGLVSECDIRYTKSGNKPWCRFTLEDFSGSHSFSLFSKDYETFMKYMQVNTALLVKCVVRQRFRKKDDEGTGDNFELRILKMALLSNTKDDFIKEFHVEIPLESATPELRKELLKEFRQHKGKARLYMDLTFTHDGVEEQLELFSKKFSVAPGYELIAFLNKKNLRHRMVTKVEM
ncbi:MAG: DNA polymerase III subunit alpha [Bacteroidales bacterium]|nr:DNA polymerase III subunit alpha [Bacteroidales bacterium]